MAAAPELDVTCPAGMFIAETPGGPAVRCWVEKEVIMARDNPTSLANFCCDEYTKCPTWRAEKKRVQEAKKPLVVEA